MWRKLPLGPTFTWILQQHSNNILSDTHIQFSWRLWDQNVVCRSAFENVHTRTHIILLKTFEDQNVIGRSTFENVTVYSSNVFPPHSSQAPSTLLWDRNRREMWWRQWRCPNSKERLQQTLYKNILSILDFLGFIGCRFSPLTKSKCLPNLITHQIYKYREATLQFMIIWITSSEVHDVIL